MSNFHSLSRPFSQACENNREPILAVLKKYFKDVEKVLEVGSGTGQHAAYFSEHMSHLNWQPADREEYLQGIRSWVQWADRKNLSMPLLLDVNNPWPVDNVQAVFSANTVHIMSWEEVVKLFEALATVLDSGGFFCLYGPFNYNNAFSSDSNARFDQWLKARDPESGIRDFEAICNLADRANLHIIADHSMPANNRILVWQKASSV